MENPVRLPILVRLATLGTATAVPDELRPANLAPEYYAAAKGVSTRTRADTVRTHVARETTDEQ
jgi:hypothetical protein